MFPWVEWMSSEALKLAVRKNFRFLKVVVCWLLPSAEEAVTLPFENRRRRLSDLGQALTPSCLALVPSHPLGFPDFPAVSQPLGEGVRQGPCLSQCVPFAVLLGTMGLWKSSADDGAYPACTLSWAPSLASLSWMWGCTLVLLTGRQEVRSSILGTQ